ncbi:MAG TPA: ABC transporter ATP-binding protein [Polyangia bacterium]
MSARLSVRGLVKRFADGRRVVDDVSFDVAAGEVVALVGESGSGKSTLARLLCGLLRADEGEVSVDRVQMVFQDPFASLNPVHTVEHHLVRPLARRGVPAHARRDEAARLLADVGLDPALAARHPHALSGGQRQRVGIARALACAPEVILADEPTSMLDVSTRLGVLGLLRRLASERRLAIVFITHDLSSAAAVADRVLVLYAGRVVESGATATVLRAPAHPYTRLLLSSAPRGERLAPAASAAPREVGPDRDSACAFFARCPRAHDRCRTTTPAPRAVAADHHVRCHLYEEGASDHAALS